MNTQVDVGRYFADGRQLLYFRRGGSPLVCTTRVVICWCVHIHRSTLNSIHIRTRKSIAAVVIRWCVPHAYLREHTQVVAATKKDKGEVKYVTWTMRNLLSYFERNPEVPATSTLNPRPSARERQREPE